MRRLLIATTMILSACNWVADPGPFDTCAGWDVDLHSAERITLGELEGLEWKPAGVPVGTVLYFSGGGFSQVDAKQIPYQVQRLVQDGWTVRSLEYTTGDSDAAHDDAYGWAVDAEARDGHKPLVAIGHSAGGTLAAGLGVSELVDGWVSVAAPFDLSSPPAGTWPWWADLVLPFDNPASYVTNDSPPGYLVHGNADSIVHEGQPLLMMAAYKRAGIGDAITYDYVNTGSETCRDHTPWCGLNYTALVAWLETIGDS